MNGNIGRHASSAGRSRARISARRRGLPCRAPSADLGPCDERFSREDDATDIIQAQLAGGDRALHEAEIHGICWWIPPRLRGGYRECRGTMRFGGGR